MTLLEIADLTFSIMAINGWNRSSIAFRAEPGSADKAFGLDKADLNEPANDRLSSNCDS